VPSAAIRIVIDYSHSHSNSCCITGFGEVLHLSYALSYEDRGKRYALPRLRPSSETVLRGREDRVKYTGDS